MQKVCQDGVNLSIFIVVQHKTISSVKWAQDPLIIRESRPVPQAPRNCKITWKFPPPGKKGTVMESQIVKNTPPYSEQNTQTNPMSVRGEPAATRFMVCNFSIPSP